MALKHGNKSYYQWVRKVAYEALQREFTSSEYKIAEAKDELMWRESVQRRIDGRKQKD